MKFLIDNQLPVQLALFLRQRGHECAHVLELGLDEAKGRDLWLRAVQLGQVLVNKDEDFGVLANQPDHLGRLVWVRLGNCRNASLIQAFDRIHDDLIKALEAGQRMVEVR